MSYYSDQGWGIQFEEYDIENLKRCIERAPKLHKDILEWFSEHNIDYETAGYDEFADYTGEEGFYCAENLVAWAMKEVTGLNFYASSCSDTSESFLYYPTEFPWETKKNNTIDVTKEDVENAITEWCSILYADKPNFKPYFIFVDCVNWG